MANFKPLNRYTNGIVTFTRNNQKFLVLRKSLKLELDNSDILVTVTQDLEKRPDLIAHKAYGNSRLWWIIYDYNGIKDPLNEVKSGKILRIPTIDRIINAINIIGT